MKKEMMSDKAKCLMNARFAERGMAMPFPDAGGGKSDKGKRSEELSKEVYKRFASDFTYAMHESIAAFIHDLAIFMYDEMSEVNELKKSPRKKEFAEKLGNLCERLEKVVQEGVVSTMWEMPPRAKELWLKNIGTPSSGYEEYRERKEKGEKVKEGKEKLKGKAKGKKSGKKKGGE